jgi:hypothetical protein
MGGASEPLTKVAMMYIGRDFDPSDRGESERYTLDFVNDLQTGDTITSSTWECEVASISEGTDGAAASHIDGEAVINKTRTTQRVSGLQPGVIYALTATVETLNGDTISLWAHVECKEPA